jgi:hypothetical protein
LPFPLAGGGDAVGAGAALHRAASSAAAFGFLKDLVDQVLKFLLVRIAQCCPALGSHHQQPALGSGHLHQLLLVGFSSIPISFRFR